MAKLISKTYGEALYEVASEKNMASEMLEEITAVKSILTDNPDLKRLMMHPGIPKGEKKDVIQKVFGGKISEELIGFMLIVVDKERYGEIEAIFEYFISKVKAEQGIGVAYVTTPDRLDVVSRGAVERKLLETTDFNKIEVNYNVDKSLIGGMVIRIGDRVVDSSIRSKLDELTKQLLQIQLG